MRLRGKSTALTGAAIALLAVLLAPTAAQAGWTRYQRPAKFETVNEDNLPVEMRDGVVLRVNVERPAGGGRHPAILIQTPYNKDGGINTFLGGSTSYFAERGYGVITADVRGTGSSGGEWDSFGPDEQRDGPELVEWARTRPWSNGVVGLWGPSYMGILQLYTAAQHPRGLKAIFPIVPMADSYRDITFSGGQVNVSFIPLWLGLVTGGGLTPLPASDDPSLALLALLSHLTGAVNFQAQTVIDATAGGETAFDGPFWKTRSPLEVVDRIRVPAFVVGGLHDLFQRGEPLVYERLKRHVPARLLMGPWTHVGGSTGEGLPRDGVPALNSIALRWFDRFLLGRRTATRIGQVPRVTQFVWGRDRYLTQRDWPDPRLRPRRLWLRGGKRLAARKPNLPEAEQGFVQQPVSGICTQSTNQWSAGLAEGIPCTENNDADQDTGAVYETARLRRPLQLSGPALARLWLTTTADEAVVTARLTDVGPNGSKELTAGWLAAGFRAVDRGRSRIVGGRLLQPWHPFTRASVMAVTPNRPTRLDVEIFPTRAVIAKGHRLRLTITPADFPHQVPPLPQFAGSLGGQVKILTEPGHRSFVELPGLRRRCAGGCEPLPVPRLLRG